MSTIENGYFVFTIMPSLYCQYNCDHCYLSLEQRRNKHIMSIEDMELTISKVADYYNNRSDIRSKTIVAYYYGGEPTSMGIPYFEAMASLFDRYMPEEKGFEVKHVILSSLLGVDIDEWLPFLTSRCGSYLQTSYDGLMRGKNYVKLWEQKVKHCVDSGLKVATISVVNSELIKAGAESTLKYLSSLGVTESGWLPFMLNEQNDGLKYGRYAPTMTAFNDYMIQLSTIYQQLVEDGAAVPEIGELNFVLSMGRQAGMSNMAGQTLFLLPDGTLCLPDYKDGYKEYFKPFGNILNESFHDVLNSESRREYLVRQALRNRNPECMTCNHKDRCLMEFAKPNKKDDECFGGKRFIDFALRHYPASQGAKTLQF